MQDAVASYCAAAEAGDIDALLATFAPDVELPSPVLGSVTFRGPADVGTVLRAVYGLIRDVRWDAPIGTGNKRLAIEHARIAGLKIDAAMYFELDAEGRIRRVRPHLRPLLATIVFTLLIGPRVAPHPGMVLRGLRGS